jgi:hypothetical protein
MPPSVYVWSGYRSARSNTGLAGNGPEPVQEELDFAFEDHSFHTRLAVAGSEAAQVLSVKDGKRDSFHLSLLSR